MQSTASAIVLAAITTTATAQAPAPIRGDYQRIAACVFKVLDPMSPPVVSKVMTTVYSGNGAPLLQSDGA